MYIIKYLPGYRVFFLFKPILLQHKATGIGHKFKNLEKKIHINYFCLKFNTMQVYSHFTRVLSLSVILSNNYDHIDSGVCRKVGKIDHDIFNIYNMHVICLQ